MTRTLLIPALFAAMTLVACDKPTTVNVPGPTVVVPGPAGPAGATGSQGASGDTGATGATGKTGEGTTVVVVPPAASAPKN